MFLGTGACYNRGTLYLVRKIDLFTSVATMVLQIYELLVSVALIVTFSLLAYIALHNWRNEIARALCILLASTVVIYGGDGLLSRALQPSTIQFLLRAQWLGIALIPAAYLHFSQALAVSYTDSAPQSQRQWLVWVGYGLSLLFFTLAFTTDLIVRGSHKDGMLTQFNARPVFGGYLLFFLSSMAFTLRTILQVHQQVVAPALRRRLKYLGATFAAPGLAIFPYLVVTGSAIQHSENFSLIFASLVTICVIGMIPVMSYSVAFQGLLVPDRLIKHDFIRWGLYGPVVGVTIILCFQLIPWLEYKFGLPGDTLITFAVMIMTVLMPILISRIRPYLDTLIYMQDQPEMNYLRDLPRSTFTGADLRQLLENTLMVMCGALAVETGFVAGPGKGGYTVKALYGSRREVKRFVAEYPLTALIPQLERILPRDPTNPPPTEAFLACGKFFLLPLRSPDGVFMGALGVIRNEGVLQENGSLTLEARCMIDALAHQIELALATAEMQQRIFDTLRDLGPEMQSLQQLGTRLEKATPASLPSPEADLSLQPQFWQLVKDALTHYWGGPKLSDSPLLGLRTVQRFLNAQGGSQTRALQAVLRQAINNLRPDDQLDPSAQEWLLYNLLELRFLQGKRNRDVAHRLAMSESDFYRKQRIAIEEVARQLVLMEDGEKHSLLR